MKLSILIPVYNEQQTIKEIISRVLEERIEGISALEIIIIDDSSTDDSPQIIQQLSKEHPEIKAYFQSKNQGKGAAIRKAIQEATGDVAIIQDADLEYSPQDYQKLLNPIIHGRADVVYGSRFITGDERRILYFKHFMGNKLLTFISNCCTDLNLTDMETCYKAFLLKYLKTIPLRSNRFGFEPEFTAKIAKRKLRVYEVSISYYGRTYEEGKKITWKDGIAAIYTIFKYLILDDSIMRDMASSNSAYAEKLE